MCNVTLIYIRIFKSARTWLGIPDYSRAGGTEAGGFETDFSCMDDNSFFKVNSCRVGRSVAYVDADFASR